jgi:hypothetical protein
MCRQEASLYCKDHLHGEDVEEALEVVCGKIKETIREETALWEIQKIRQDLLDIV